MGSDLYMESRNWRPRGTVVCLNGRGRWVIYRDAFYSGYVAVKKTVPDTPEVRQVFKALGFKVVKEAPNVP